MVEVQFGFYYQITDNKHQAPELNNIKLGTLFETIDAEFVKLESKLNKIEFPYFGYGEIVNFPVEHPDVVIVNMKFEDSGPEYDPTRNIKEDIKYEIPELFDIWYFRWNKRDELNRTFVVKKYDVKIEFVRVDIIKVEAN
jgi:hypothetical protein